MFAEHQFAATLLGLKLAHDPATYLQLEAEYSAPDRHYHDCGHVTECLSHLNAYRALAARPFEIEMAIWFHDAIYDTRAADSEAKSAVWAFDFLLSREAAPGVGERVAAMIRATKTHEALGADCALLLDIDLGILGAPAEDFEEYDAAIRTEYFWVPEEQYRPARAQILSHFLQRQTIYQTTAFKDLYERQARLNLSAKIQELNS